MGKPESQIEKYLLTQSKKNNINCYKFTAPSNSGVPDRILIGNGYTIFIELKAPKKKPRLLQWSVIKSMRMQGADIFVIDNTKDIDILIKYIKTHPIKRKKFSKMQKIGIEQNNQK